MDTKTTNKRQRESDDSGELPLLDPKRLHEDLLLDILDDDWTPDSQADLATVIKTLEDEISLPSTPREPKPQPELGFLQEASDDDLGLPAAAEAWRLDDEFGGCWDGLDLDDVGFEGEGCDGSLRVEFLPAV